MPKNQKEAPPEPDEPAEQLEARPRKQTLCSHEISAAHTDNAVSNDIVISHSDPLPQEQNQPKPTNNTNNEPQPSTQRRGEAPNAGGSQDGQGQPLNTGELTSELGVPTETTLSRSPMDTCHTARRQEKNTRGKTGPVTVEEGVQGRPREPSNGYPGPQLNLEEEKVAEQEVIRPSKADSTGHLRSNHVHLLHKNTTQVREAEYEPVRT